MSDSIFVKIYNNKKKINKKDIFNSIPKNALDYSDEELKKTNTEWRWRIYNIDDKEYIEISYTKDGKQLFLNHDNKWISYPENMLKSYKKSIIKEYYYYTK